MKTYQKVTSNLTAFDRVKFSSAQTLQNCTNEEILIQKAAIFVDEKSGDDKLAVGIITSAGDAIVGISPTVIDQMSEIIDLIDEEHVAVKVMINSKTGNKGRDFLILDVLDCIANG